MTTKIGVAGVKGAGGVTTAAVSLAAAWAAQGPTMLVEADPSGGSLLGWSEDLRAAGDLYEVAMARQSGGLASVAQRFGDMAVVPAWGRPFRLTQALSRPRVPWEVLFDEVGGTVVVDVGRVAPDSPTLGVLASLDVLVLVAASEPGPVSATMEWASRGGRHGAADVGLEASRLRMVTSEVVGRRRRMSVTPRDLPSMNGPTFLGHLPHDEAAVDLLVRGASISHRSLRHRPFVEVAVGLAAALSDPAWIGVGR